MILFIDTYKYNALCFVIKWNSEYIAPFGNVYQIHKTTGDYL